MIEVTQTNRPARQVYVDALKGLGIILVVWGHFEEYYRGTSPVFNGSFECIYLFHMALFCLCSGLVAKLNLKKYIGQQLWLYLLCQGGLLAFRAVVLTEDIAAAEGGLLGAFLLPWRHMWYLYALLFWELTVPLLRLLRDKLGFVGGLLGFGAALAVGLLAGGRQWPFTLNRVFAFFPFFAFGVVFRQEVARWYAAVSTSLPVRWVLGGVAAVVYGSWFVAILRQAEPVYEGARIFHDAPYGAGYTMATRAAFYLIGILTTLALVAVLGNSRTLASLGRRTLPVYILHMPVLAFLIELGTYAPPNEKGALAVAGWVVFAAGGTVCLLAAKPVCALFTGVANLWYKGIPALLRQKKADGEA
ncbi:MAG: acyltransferase family protein [Gemmiger sp.]|nr:acyltransferase family protein [Gemmiger sp.]